MRFVCVFYGGRYDGKAVSLEEAERMTEKRSEDLSEIRAMGGLVRKKELDNKPEFDGSCGPMWDGTMRGNTIGILRYETWDVYDMLSR